MRTKLKERGIEVTQATLSRDLKYLGIVRVFDPRNGYIYSIPSEAYSDNSVDNRGEVNTDLIEDILDIQFSGNLAVIKTKLGHATGVAFDIDRLKIPEVIGTVGGDDTLIVVLKEGAKRENILKYFKGFQKDRSKGDK